jgi:hypothetical protein
MEPKYSSFSEFRKSKNQNTLKSLLNSSDDEDFSPRTPRDDQKINFSEAKRRKQKMDITLDEIKKSSLYDEYTFEHSIHLSEILTYYDKDWKRKFQE